MKKTQFIELIKNIRKTLVSYVSIIFFVVLGTALFLGIGWVKSSFTLSINNTLNDTNVHDFEISYPYGLTDEAVKMVSNIEGIDFVEGVYSTEAFFKYDDLNYQAKIISLTNTVDTLYKTIGEIPSKKGEIAFERNFAESHGLKIGDVIIFKHDSDNPIGINDLLKEDLDLLNNKTIDSDGMNVLTTDKFIITGLVESGVYMNQYRVTYGVSSKNIPNDCIAYVAKESFDANNMAGYSTIVVLCNSIHKDLFNSDEYKDNYDKYETIIKEKLQTYTDNRFNEINQSISNIKKKAHDKYDEGLEEYNDSKKLLEDSEKKIRDGKIELANGKKTLEDGQTKIDEGWVALNAGKQQANIALRDINNINCAYKSVHGMVSAISYVNNYKDSIKTGIVNVHDVYAIESSLIDSELYDYLYVIDAVNDLYDRDVYLYDAPQLTAEYIKFLYNISSNSKFTSFNDIYIKFLDLEASLPEGIQKDNIGKIVNGLMTLLGPSSDVLYLSDNIYTLYCNLKLINADDLLNNEIIDIVNDDLSALDPSISFKTILQKIIDDVVNDRQSFNDLYNAFANCLTYVASTDYETIKTIVENYQYLIDDSMDQCYKGLAAIDESEKELKNAQLEINNGWDEYNKNLKLLKNNERKIKNGWKELDEGYLDIIDAQKKLKELDDKLPVLDKYDSNILGRNSNAGVASAVVPTNIINNIKYTMAFLFVLVGAFVCYSALSRIVYDQTVQIGTKKALGFNSKEITGFYLLYAFSATTIGSILGTLFARFLIEPLMVKTVASNYIVGELTFTFSIEETILFYIFELAITITATLLACNNTLKRPTTQLLTNQNQLLGKKRFFEKFGIWKRTSLLLKTIINNCLNDTKRVFAALIGIVGCSSLLVCAATLVFNSYDSLNYQLNVITPFDTIVYFDSDNENALNEISKVLESKNIEYVTSINSSYIAKSPIGTYLSNAFFSYTDDEFKNYFRTLDKGKPLENTEGVYVTNAYLNYYNLKVGDPIVIINSNGEELNAPIAGAFDYYVLRSQIVVPNEYYEKLFNEKPKVNTFIFNIGDISIKELAEELNSIDGYISTFDYAGEVKQINGSLISAVVVVAVLFFVLSFVLAMLVLLNLMVVFVEEKKRELIVLMINGYERKDAKKYIYGDTIFLTIFGIIVGSILGSFAGIFTLKTFDGECVTVIQNITIPGCIICAILTAVLSGMACLIALRKIDKFELTDINKA